MIGDKNKIPNNDNNKKVIIKTNIGGLNKNPKMLKIKNK